MLALAHAKKLSLFIQLDLIRLLISLPCEVTPAPYILKRKLLSILKHDVAVVALIPVRNIYSHSPLAFHTVVYAVVHFTYRAIALRFLVYADINNRNAVILYTVKLSPCFSIIGRGRKIWHKHCGGGNKYHS